MPILIYRRQSNAWMGAAVLLALCWPMQGQTPGQTPAPDLSQASIDDLMNIPVTSVSKKEQKLSAAGAAIFVIGQEDIRRSGATNIPDLLRLVPGVDVAQVNANHWAISIRGFNDQHANKILVLIDGRTVYNPTLSGTVWDVQVVPLEDIDRIEVIRGPGGTVWGANAVNGVINIITKSAQATKGGLLVAGAGSHDRADALVQYGADIGRNGAYRVYGEYFDIANSVLPGGRRSSDGSSTGQAGFHSDWDLSPRDSLTVQGDFLKLEGGETITTVIANALPLEETFDSAVTATTGNVLGRWNHTLANGSQMALQVYDDYTRQLEQGFSITQNTVDVDFQHHFTFRARNDVVWGLGVRAIDIDFAPGYTLKQIPARQWDYLFSAFAQDELKLTGSLSLTLGSKVEHNSFTGIELSPSLQLVWAPTGKQTVWASAARAIREPGSADEGVQVDAAIVPAGPTFGVVRILGNHHLRAEELRDFEAGYRAQADKRLSLDATVFYSLYRNLVTQVAQAPYFASQQGVPYLVFPLLIANAAGAHNYGGEFFANWNIAHRWRVSPGYSYYHMNVSSNGAALAGTSPNHQFQVRSLLDLSHHLQWDNTVGYVSHLAAGSIPAYVRLDTRLGWRVGESVELSLVGQNLLTARHAEFADGYDLHHTLVQRSVFAKVTWRF